jgi:hypothetical protein
MCDKPVHTRSDIHVFFRPGFEDHSRYQHILPEVFVPGRTTLFVPIMQARPQFKTAGVARVEAEEIVHISRQASQRTKSFPWVNTELGTEEPIGANEQCLQGWTPF